MVKITSIEQKARTRDALVTAARELFHHHGYEVVTIRQVAKAAGFSTGAIFASFPDGKSGLFEAAMGEKAPDVAAFLLKVASTTGIPELSREAMVLRGHLRGHHA